MLTTLFPTITSKVIFQFIAKTCAVFLLVCANICSATIEIASLEKALLPYPRAEVVESENVAVVDYPIAMGEMKKVRGIWAPEKERRLEGNIQRLTLQIPNGHSPQEVFDFYFQKLSALSARALFHCEARLCGASNAWANELFEIKQLYGLDQQQSYAAFELLDTNGALHFVSIYTVIRGNKRVYAHTQWLQTSLSERDASAPSVEEIVAAIKEGNGYLVQGLEFNEGKIKFDDERLDTLVSAILLDRRSRLKIITASEFENTALTTEFIKLLGRKGVPSQRLRTESADFINQEGDTQTSNGEGLIKIELISE